MADFELADLGGGKFALSGAMSFDNAERLLRASESAFADHSQIEVDLSAVHKSDSAGLALLLEWITWANHSVREIRFVAVPDRILAIAKTSEVEQLLQRGERWAGFIEAPEESS
jgi:phospholipid transport system transporter-binding protein